MAKDWAKPLYNSGVWREVRAYILRRDKYLCQCYKLYGGEPCGYPAGEVHHITELTPENISDPVIALGEDNLISLYGTHHKGITRKSKVRQRRGRGKIESVEYVFDADGKPIPPGSR